jgi:hypothetical protein
MAGYLWTVSAGGTITAGAGTNQITVTWHTTGAQIVSVNYTDLNGCTATTPTVLNVTVNPLPLPTITGSAVVCAGTTGVTYTTEAGMVGYLWTVSAGGIITAGAGTNIITVTWNTAGAQTVSVNYTDLNGCTALTPTVFNVTVNPLPVPTISGPSVVCAVTSGNIYTTEAGMTGYTWTVSAGGTIVLNAGNAIMVTWNIAGAQFVSVNYIDPNGCSAATPTVFNVTVNPLPAPTITGPATSCAGSTGVVYSTEAGMTNYIWSVSPGGINTGGGTSTDNTITVTWVNPGPQWITVNYTDPNGCTALTPTQFNVTVFPLPVPTITGTAVVCAGTTGVTYTTEAGMSSYAWTISAGGTITGGAGTNQITVTWNTAGAQSVSVNYADGNGCFAATPTVLPVTVNPLPVPTLTGPTPVCVNSTGNIYSTDAGMANYVWSVSAGGTITAGGGAGNSTVTVTWNASGAQSVSVSYTDLNGCTAATPTILPVIVNPLPVPILTGPTPVCVNSSGNVYITDAGMTSYVWSVSPGGIITGGGGAGNNTVTVTWNTSGAQWVSVNYTDLNGCTAAAPTVLPVTVNPLPIPTLIGPTPVCINSTGNIYTTDAGMTNYVWTVSAGGTITAGGGAANNTVTVTWNTSGAQWVSVNYTDLNGCTAAAPTVLPVTVNPLPIPTLIGPTPVCVNSTGNIYTTDAGMSNYLWTVSAGGTITAGGGPANNTVTVTWNTSGAQSVSVSYTDLNGCTAGAPTVLPVTVNPLPVPTLSGPTPVCVTSAGNVYSTDAGMTNYIWSVSPGGTITGGGGPGNNTVTVTWNAIGAQSVSVSYTDLNGCTAAAPTVFTVTVNPLPVPTLSGPTPVCVTSTGNVYTTDAGMTNYVWTISAGGTITAGGGAADNTVTVTWNTAGAQSVSVNFTDLNGCTAPAPTILLITVNPLPIPTLSGPTPVCNNSSGNVYTTDAGMNNYVWAVSAGGTITAGGGATNNTVTITWNTAGAQWVSVNYTNLNGCTAAAPTVFPVTVNPLPVPILTGPTPVCVTSTGNVYSTTAGMTNYVWTVSGGGTITAGGGTADNTVTVTWNTSGAQSVSVSYTDLNGCTAAVPTVLPVTVNALPVPILTGPTPVCVNSTGNVYSTTAGMTNYVWTVSAGGTITAGGGAVNNTVTVTWNTSGAQSVSVNYTDLNGCTAASPTVLPVTVNPLPVPALAGPTSVCVNSTGNVYTTDAGMTNYLWAVSAGGTITAGGGAANNTVTVTWNTSGAQSVSVNYTDLNGCTAATPTVLNVTVNPLPVPTITGLTAVCAGTTGVTYTTQAGMTGYIWTVSAGGTITAGTGTNVITVTWNTAGAQTVSVNYTNANGCTAATPTVLNVTVNPLPVPTITGTAVLCQNTSGTYTTEAGMTGYLWTVSAGGTITSGSGTNSIVVLWSTSGAKTVTVNYTNANGCTAATPTVFNVTVNPLPVPTITGSTSVCAGTSGVTYATQTGMTGYTWAISAGGTITAGAGTNQITVTWNTAGSQTVSVNYTNTNGCTAATPTVLNVTVYPRPVPTITGASAVCAGTTGVIYTTEPGMTGYIWTISAGGTITSGSGTNTITVTWTTPGAQTLTVNYTNANGCNATTPTVKNVTVNPLPVPTITGTAALCQNSNGTYTTEAGMTGYIWTVSAGGTIISGAGTNSIVVQWTTPGAKTVTVNYTNANGCTAATPTSFAVTVNPLPVPSITGQNSVCVGTSGVIYTTEPGMTGYIWTISAGGTITAGLGTNAITVTWNSVGTNAITVNYTNANGCTAATPTLYTVTVNPLPVPTITGSNNLCVNSGYYNYQTEAGMTNYLWTVSPGGTITSGAGTNIITVVWNIPGAQFVTVNYTSPQGCTALSPTVYNVTVNPLPGNAGAITGASAVCGGDSGVPYSIPPVPNAITYVWLLPPGASIASGAGTPNITVDFAANASSGNITAYGNNLCGNGGSSSLYVTVTPLVGAAGAITGDDQVCQGETGIVYSVDSISGATSYTWTVPPGATIVSGANTNVITVDYSMSATSGDVTVFGSNSCGNGASSALSVNVNPIPGAPTVTSSGDTLISSAPVGNQWYFEGNPIPGATGQTYVADHSGWYWATVTLFGCTSDTSNHVYILITAIAEPVTGTLNVYPVPNDGRFTTSIVWPGEEFFTIVIYNNVGVKIHEVRDVHVNGKAETNFDLRPLPNGVYSVVFLNQNNKVVRRILVNR